jgi:hypothetical protein
MSNINKSGYNNMDWVLALKARKNPIDYEAQLASSEECADNVVERTLEAAYNLPTTEETSAQALKRVSKEIQASQAAKEHKANVDFIRTALADRGIDPVALGVAKADEWTSSLDLEWVEKKATEAALLFEKKLSTAWEEEAKKSVSSSMGFDPKASKEGRIMPNFGTQDETCSRPSRVPANANSIFDPFKLDRFAKEENAHDKAILAKRDQAAARAEKVAKERIESARVLPTEQKRNRGRVVPSGGSPTVEQFAQRTPANQISMSDDLAPKAGQSLKDRIAELFTDKVRDSKAKIQASQAERKQKITAKREGEGEKPWDSKEHLKPTSTKDLTERLKNLWMPESKE